MPSGNKPTDEEPKQLLFPKRRSFLKTLGVGGAAAGLAGCTGEQGSGDETTTGGETATDSGTTTDDGGDGPSGYVSGDATDAQSLNFLSISDQPSANRVGLTLDSAYAITTDNEVFPLWADISSDDGRVYTVELRDNLQWGADYGQMTSEDWVYMIKEVFQAEDNWAGYPNQSDWQRGGEPIPVEKTSTTSFEIQLPEVDPAFPLKPIMWGSFCMPKGLIEKYRPDNDQEGLAQDEEVQTLAYAGNLGPYSFESWDRESAFVATRNEDYYMREASDVPDAWTEAPYFDSYTYQVIPEESTRLSALQTGEIDASGIPETKVSQFEGQDNVDVKVIPQAYMSSLIYNQRANGNFYEALRIKEVRQALAHVVNKEAIADNILRGYATVAHTFQPQFSDWYVDDQVTEYGVGDTYDHETARNMLENNLDSTPYSYDGDTIVDSDGDPVTLSLVFAQGTETTQTTAEFIAQEYGKIGLDVEVNGVQFNTLLNKYVANSYQGSGEPEYNAGPYNGGNRDNSLSQESWDLMTGIIFNTYPRTPSSTRDFSIKQGGINYYGYYPETDFNALFDEATTTVDEDARKDVYAEIFGALSEEQPFNFLNMGVDIIGYDSRVEGPVEEFGSGWDTNIWRFAQQ
jgi:peptide/nickel transport system substrate-binding protein